MRLRHTPIAVDEFTFIPGVYIYLLSHLHTDHTAGLTPSWNCGTVYTSPVTRALLLHRFRLPSSLVVALDENIPHTVPLDPHRSATMQITLIDANHCPGACMFLLDGYFGRLLITGDFRFSPEMLRSLPVPVDLSCLPHTNSNVNNNGQHNNNQPYSSSLPVDVLYLDDTFLDPRADFPPRSEAGERILNIIDRYPPHTQILIGIDHLGKEELLVAIALRFRTLIVVTEDRLRDIRIIQEMTDLPDVFTHRPTDGRVHVLPRRRVSRRAVAQANDRSMPNGRMTIGIIPSGWAATRPGPDTDAAPRRLPALRSTAAITRAFTNAVDSIDNIGTTDKDNNNNNNNNIQGGRVYVVPYSLHSSYRELMAFVSAVRPAHLVSTSRGDTPALMRCFGHLLRRDDQAASPQTVSIPRSVQLSMDAKKSSFNRKSLPSVTTSNNTSRSHHNHHPSRHRHKNKDNNNNNNNNNFATTTTTAKSSTPASSSIISSSTVPSKSRPRLRSRSHQTMLSRGAKISNRRPSPTTTTTTTNTIPAPSSSSSHYTSVSHHDITGTTGASPPRVVSPIDYGSPSSVSSDGLLDGLFEESDGELSVAAEAALVDLHSVGDASQTNGWDNRDVSVSPPPRKRIRRTLEHIPTDDYGSMNDINHNNNNNKVQMDNDDTNSLEDNICNDNNFSDAQSFHSLLSVPTESEYYEGEESYLSSSDESQSLWEFNYDDIKHKENNSNNNSPLPDLSLSLSPGKYSQSQENTNNNLKTT